MDMDGAADFMAGDPSGRVDLDASAWKRARISSVQLLWSRCYRGPFLIGRGLMLSYAPYYQLTERGLSRLQHLATVFSSPGHPRHP